MAPLLATYLTFVQDTGMESGSLREIRHILHSAHQALLRGGNDSAHSRRDKALRDIERELIEQVRPEEVERVMSHPFVQQLLSSNEHLFEPNARGIIHLRQDVGAPPPELEEVDLD